MCCRTSKFDIEPQNTNLRPASVDFNSREGAIKFNFEISKIRKVLNRWIDLCHNELG
jgi:hypothetical protein